MIEKQYTFPFSAIVGQDDFKLALILNLVDPLIGGVLAIGDKGTGKTTLIRSLTNLISNQENASYPLCICAERVALYNVGTTLKAFTISALAITARSLNNTLDFACMPCGACRQVIQEFETRQNKKIKLFVTSVDLKEVIEIDGINHILPIAFSKASSAS